MQVFHHDTVRHLFSIDFLLALFHFLQLLGQGIVELTGTLQDGITENMPGGASGDEVVSRKRVEWCAEVGCHCGVSGEALSC